MWHAHLLVCYAVVGAIVYWSLSCTHNTHCEPTSARRQYIWRSRQNIQCPRGKWPNSRGLWVDISCGMTYLDSLNGIMPPELLLLGGISDGRRRQFDCTKCADCWFGPKLLSGTTCSTEIGKAHDHSREGFLAQELRRKPCWWLKPVDRKWLRKALWLMRECQIHLTWNWLTRIDGLFLSAQLQRAVIWDALVDALETVPGDYKEEGSHEDDSSSAELQKVREENDFLKRHLGEMKTKLDKVTERMR